MTFRQYIPFAVAALLLPAAVCSQSIAFNGSGVQVLANNGAEPSAALNPAGTHALLVYGVPNTYTSPKQAAQTIEVKIVNTRDGQPLTSDSLGGSESGYGYNDDGEPETGETTCAWAPDGKTLVVAWEKGDEDGVAFQIFHFETSTNSLTRSGSIQSIGRSTGEPSIDFFSDSSFVVAYEGAELWKGDGVRMRHYAATGEEISSGAVSIASSTSGDQQHPKVAIRRSGALATDTVYAVWKDARTTRYSDDEDVNYRLFDSALNAISGDSIPVPASNLVGADSLGNPAVVVAPTGEWAIAYEVEDAPDGSDETAWATFFDSSNAPVSGIAVDIDASNSDISELISARYNPGNNGFAFAWTSESKSNGFPVTMTHLDGSGRTQTVDLQNGSTSEPEEGSMDIREGQFVAVWVEDGSRADTQKDAVYYRVGGTDTGN